MKLDILWNDKALQMKLKHDEDANTSKIRKVEIVLETSTKCRD